MWWSDKFEYSIGRVSDFRFWGSRLEFWSGSSLFFSSSYTSLIITVYMIIFAPTCKPWIRPEKVVFKERQYETLYSSSLKFVPDNEGERSENKMGGNISLCTVCNQIGPRMYTTKLEQIKNQCSIESAKGYLYERVNHYTDHVSERGSTGPIIYTLSELLPSESHFCELSCDCGAVLTLLVWINASSCSFLAARSDWVCRRASIWISMSSSCSLISSSSFLCPKSP